MMSQTNPILFPVMLALLLLGLTCLIRPIIVVKFLAFWTRWIFPKEFRNPETFSNLEKALDLLDKNPSHYETQYDSQITLVKFTGGISLLIFFISLCMVLSSGR
jgi:hypothetical protein